MNKMRKMNAFTLPEVMVTLILSVIIISVAYFSYNYLLQGFVKYRAITDNVGAHCRVTNYIDTVDKQDKIAKAIMTGPEIYTFYDRKTVEPIGVYNIRLQDFEFFDFSIFDIDIELDSALVLGNPNDVTNRYFDEVNVLVNVVSDQSTTLIISEANLFDNDHFELLDTQKYNLFTNSSDQNKLDQLITKIKSGIPVNLEINGNFIGARNPDQGLELQA